MCCSVCICLYGVMDIVKLWTGPVIEDLFSPFGSFLILCLQSHPVVHFARALPEAIFYIANVITHCCM